MARLHGKRWLASATDPSGTRLRPSFLNQACAGEGPGVMDIVQLIAHLETAQRAVDGIALGTVKALAAQGRATDQIEAAQCLKVAAIELFGVAHDIASGKPTEGHGAPMGPTASPLAVALRLAEIKVAEAKWRLSPEIGSEYAAALERAVQRG